MGQRPGTGAQSIGARLRRLRLEQGLSQRDLSEPGVTYAYISRIEAGARQPSVKALRMLARRLGVTPEYLETGSELGGPDLRELRISEQELRLRLDGTVDLVETRALLEEAESGADPATATRARIVLGFHAAALGDHPGAIEHLAAVVGSELVDPAARPDVYATLGRSQAATGVAHAAVELFDSALAALGPSSPANRSARIRYSTYLSYALTDLGELSRARAALVAANEATSVDRTSSVRVHWSRGRLALEQAQPLAALDSFRRAIALLEETEDAVNLARAHLACADAVLGAGDELPAAVAHLDEAERLLGSDAARDDLAVLRRLQARSRLVDRDAPAAAELAVEAATLGVDLPSERGLAILVLAEARVVAGDPGSDAAFLEALELLERHGGVRDRAQALRAYARFLREAGREREALDVLERAADAASSLHGEPARRLG